MTLFKSIRFLSLTLVLGLTNYQGRPAEAKTKASATVVWPTVALVPFTVVPQDIEGANARPDQNALSQRLAEEATTRAERLLLMRHIGAKVERTTSIQNVTAPVFVTGSVSLPLSLPPGVIGWKARSRKGPFVTARAVLTDAAGRVLAQEEVTLDWNDVRWLRGARTKHNLPLEDVLLKFTRKSVDGAIEAMQQKIHASQGGQSK
jgi:hypothetical protein